MEIERDADLDGRIGEQRYIPVKEIDPNPINPRKRRNQAADAELTASIARHGVLQPILVRPNPRGTTAYETVIGERRWRCSDKAGLEVIPARVVDPLIDDECLEIMLVENGRREDLDPIEEAQTYHDLARRFKLTLADIAVRVGKSKTTVHQRMKLVDLIPPVRRALVEGKLELSVAELIARCVHPTQQLDAFKYVGATTWRSATPYREAKRTIEAEFMLSLSGAAWKMGDEALYPKAGACAVCTKRTQNQPDLFGDASKKDVCLDPGCFAEKGKRARKARLEAAAADGAEILEGKNAEAVFDLYGHVKSSSGYVNLAAAAPLAQAGKRAKSYARVLGKTYLPPVTVVEAPDGRKVLELAKKADVERALKAKGVKLATRRTKSAGSSDGVQRRRRALYAGTVYDAQIAEVIRAIEGTSAPDKIWGPIAKAVLESVWQDASDAATRRRGLAKKGHKLGGGHALAKVIEKAKPGEALGLIVELLAQRERPRERARASLLPKLASCYGVNLTRISSQCASYARALEKSKTKTKPVVRKKASRSKAKRKATRKRSPRR